MLIFRVQVLFSLFLIFLIGGNLLASPFLLEEIANFDPTPKKEMSVPNPVSLDPQWWNYFDVEGEELKHRIAAAQRIMQELYSTLPFEDQSVALGMINKTIASLTALSQAKSLEFAPAPISQPFLKSYTFEKLLELTREMRKVISDTNNEQKRLDQLKERLAKAHKNIDNSLVAYMAMTQSSSKKTVLGLEIMTLRSNVGVGEQNQHLAESRLDVLNGKLKKISEELEYAKLHLDFHDLGRSS